MVGPLLQIPDERRAFKRDWRENSFSRTEPWFLVQLLFLSNVRVSVEQTGSYIPFDVFTQGFLSIMEEKLYKNDKSSKDLQLH